jgi:hypothetical protein
MIMTSTLGLSVFFPHPPQTMSAARIAVEAARSKAGRLLWAMRDH